MENPATSATKYPSGTLHSSFDKVAELFPDRDACVVYHSEQDRESITFQDLRLQSEQFAKCLLRKGLGKGDIVGLLATNSVGFIVSFLALSRLGAPVLLLRYGSTHEEVRDLLVKHDSKGLIASTDCRRDEEVITNIQRSMAGDDKSENLVIIKLQKKEVYWRGDTSDEKHTTDQHPADSLGFPEVGPEDACAIFFTSGSTGDPKAMVFQHRAMIARSNPWGEVILEMGPAVFFNDRPMAWTGGFYVILNMCVFGVCAVTINSNLSVASGEISFVLNVLRDERCTHALLMNYLLVDFSHVNSQRHNDLSNLKYVITAGQKADQGALVHLLTTLPKVTLVYMYGLGETGIVLHQCHTDPRSLHDEGFTIHQGIDISITGTSGEIAPTGTPGEICICSPAVLEAYHNNSDATSKAFLLGKWFRTGDMGFERDDGKIVLLGRTDDMIKRATVKVFPVEVERVLRKHPHVKEVVVIGVPNQRLFEDLCACIIPRDPGSFVVGMFVEWCKAQFSVGPDGLSLSPTYVLVFDHYPKTKTGKTSRKELTAEAKRRLRIASS